MQTITVNEALLLKQIELADANDVFETINSQRTYLRKWLPFVDHTRDIEDSIQFIKTVNRNDESVFVLNYQQILRINWF